MPYAPDSLIVGVMEALGPSAPGSATVERNGTYVGTIAYFDFAPGVTEGPSFMSQAAGVFPGEYTFDSATISGRDVLLAHVVVLGLGGPEVFWTEGDRLLMAFAASRDEARSIAEAVISAS